MGLRRRENKVADGLKHIKKKGGRESSFSESRKEVGSKVS